MSFFKLLWMGCALGMALLGVLADEGPRRDWMVLLLGLFFVVFLLSDLIRNARRTKDR